MKKDVVRNPSQDDAHRVKVDGAALARHTRHIRSVLLRKGVRRCDVADVTQEVFLAAWRAIEEGRFCPRLGRDLDEAIHDWLFGIAWRKASDYRDLRCWTVEVLRHTRIEPAVETMPEEQFDARRVLDLFERVRRNDRELILRVALGDELQVAAHDLGLTKEAGSARLRRGREAFAQIIARRQNYPRRLALPSPSTTCPLPDTADECLHCHGTIAGIVYRAADHFSAAADARREIAAYRRKVKKAKKSAGGKAPVPAA